MMMMMMMIMMAMMIKYDNDNLVPHQNNFQEGPVKEKKLLFTGQTRRQQLALSDVLPLYPDVLVSVRAGLNMVKPKRVTNLMQYNPLRLTSRANR